MAKMTNEVNKPTDDRECRNFVHVHTYITNTNVADEHQHMLLGTTAPARREGISHIHRIRIRTSYFFEGNAGHWHWVDVCTTPAVEAPDGMHIHYISGETSFDDNHEHTLFGSTSPNMLLLATPLNQMPTVANTKYKGIRDDTPQ